MPGSLSTYWKKRDFGVTGEPKGEVKARAGKRLSFVVQKHAATRLHYDVRLELEGTLKSWAVPKGPSFDPKVRRMAVHTEDHPLSYATFEGVIPKGQYGAGTMIVWDRGEWEPIGDPVEGYRKGRLKFELHGEKLRGRWNLVRINSRGDERQEPWLLIKETDEEARSAADYDVTEALPDSVLTRKTKARTAKAEAPAKKASASRAKAKPKSKRGAPAMEMPAGAVPADLPFAFFPQLATLVDEPPRGGGWVYEVKFDGYRLLARIDGDDVRLFTRNGNDWSSRLKALVAEVRSLALPPGWYDGEIVLLDEHGNPSFQALQGAFDNAKTKDIVLFLFDAPYLAGHDMTRVPLIERRRLLEAALGGKTAGRVRFSQTFDAPVEKLLEGACEKGLEGLIGKRADSGYVSARSNAWIKLKCHRRQEFVIVGFSDPKGSRTGFGSLLLGVHDADGRLVYAGNVGTGFNETSLKGLMAKMEPLRADKSPLVTVPRGVKGHWIRPRLIAEVAFTEWTSDGRIRHPVFHGLRTDKDVQAITREQAKAPAPSRSAAAVRAAAAEAAEAAEGTPRKATSGVVKARPVKEKPAAREKAGKQVVEGLAISHPERVIDARSKATKLDLVRYYEAISEHMLPHLVGRPIALVRAPTGIGGELFFQKHGEKIRIPGIVQLPRSYWPGHPAMLEIASRETLVGAAQMNVIEMHTWNSTTADIAHPDRVIFDLDPGEGIDWATLKEATAITRKALDLLGLESFLKTSGGKGLHVVVPLTPSPEWGYDPVKDFSEKLVVHMSRTLPKLFVAKSGAQNRVGRIFIDYLRNGKGATTIAAFSARARPGLGVSVPVAWKELPGLEAANQWDIFNVFERLEKKRADPWKDYWGMQQTLDEAAKKLG